MERKIGVLEAPAPEYPVVRIIGLKMFYSNPEEIQ